MAGAQLDPLVIDLTGQGLHLLARSASSPYFDFTRSGFAHNTGWIGAGTGFLAITGADGLVHDGTQLFGSASQDGFAALRALDSNGDGVIDAQDAGFGTLVVWQDLNGDGVCQPGEVSTLAQLGVASLSLKTTTVWQAHGDATIAETALATMADGTTREVAEANLNVSSVYTRDVADYTLDPDAYVLPGLQGYGSLPSLSISLSQDGQLKTLVQQLVRTDPSDTAVFDAAMRAMLYRWAGVDGTAPESGGAFNGQELGFLRKLLGNTTGFGWGGASSTPWFEGQSNLLQKSWDTAYSGLKARLLAQLPGSPFARDFFVAPGADLVVPNGRLSTAIADLASHAPADPSSQFGYWSNVLLMVSTSVSDLQQFGIPDTGPIKASLQAVVPALFSPDILAAAASGTLSLVEGTALGGKLAGTPGSDLFVVEQPNAVLTGLSGGDEFVVGAGLGAVEINEADNTASAHNMLLLNGITPSQVAVSGDAAGSIILTLADGGTIKLDNMLVPPGSGWQVAEGHGYNALAASTRYGVQEVRFADGTIWDAQQLVQQELSATANGGDTLYGTTGADILDGQGLKHVVQGNGGGDTFAFGQGYGALEVKEMDGSPAAANVLQLGSGITAAQVTASGTAAGDIVLTTGSAGDAVKLDGMLASTQDGVQAVRFADGTTWTAQQVRALAATGSPGNTSLVNLIGMATLDPAGYAHLGTTRGGNDTVLFDAGYGSVEINQRDGNAQDDNILRFGPRPGHGQRRRERQRGAHDGQQWRPRAARRHAARRGQRRAGGPLRRRRGLGRAADRLPGARRRQRRPVLHDVHARPEHRPGRHGGRGHGRDHPRERDRGRDACLQVDAAGNLVVRLRDDPNDSLTVGNALYSDGNGVRSRLSQFSYADGTTLDLTKQLTLTWLASATNLSLSGSNDGANLFVLAPGGDVATGSSRTANTYAFHKGDGQATIIPTGGSNTIQLASDIAASDVALQADDATGDLMLRVLGTGDTLTVKGDLSRQGWGVQSQVGQIAFGDGTALHLGQSYCDQGQPLVFTWVGAGSGAPLVGSGFGSNTFILGPGGTHAVAGNGSLGGSGQNTVVFGKGDGQAIVNPNGGSGTIQFGPGISAGDLTFQADDATGDLTILDGSMGDSVVLKGDLGRGNWGGPTSRVGQITFSDGSALQLGQTGWWDHSLLTFTWTGTATNTTLVGSSYGHNVFQFAAGGDTVTGGQYGNTYLYKRKIGAATININGDSTLKLGIGVSASDLTFQANDAPGDLAILDGAVGDSITLKGDLGRGNWGGPTSKVGQLTFADGRTLQFGQNGWRDHNLLNFTAIGTAANTVLVGSSYGNNTFVLGAGGDQVTFGNGNSGGSQSNTIVFGKGDGQATVNPNGASGGQIRLTAGIAPSDVALSGDLQGDLVLALKGTGDSLTVAGGSTAVQNVLFADGTTWTPRLGTPGSDRLYGASGPNIFDGQGGGDYEQGNGAGDTFVYKAGYGQLEVSDWTQVSAPTNTLAFGPGIMAAQVSVSQDSSENAILTDAVSGDRMQLDGKVTGPDGWNHLHGVAMATFADGTTWTQSQIAFLAGMGTSGSDTITGTPGNDVFDGRGGADTISGKGGYDTYLFRQGYGALTIDNSVAGGTQAQGEVDFGPGITGQNLWFSQVGSDLVASVLGSNDTVDIKGWFGGNPGAQLAGLKAFDGMMLDGKVGQLVSAMAAYQGANPGYSPATMAAMPNNPSLRSAIAAAWHG